MSRIVFVESSGLGNRALAHAKDRGHHTTLLWSPRYDFFTPAPLRREARELVDLAIEVDDLYDPGQVSAALRAHGIGASDVDIVLTTVQMCVIPAARLAETLGARGTSLAALTAAKDKAACRRVLDAHRLPNLGFAEVTDVGAALAAAARIGYPVVLKPVTGLAKTATTIAAGPDDVTGHFRRVAERLAVLAPAVRAELDGRFLVEEFATGPLLSVEVATDGETCTPLVVVRRKTGADNPTLELGSTVPSGLGGTAEREIGTYAADVCRALGLDLGIFHVEVIHTVRGPRLVEVNPRIAGGTVPEVIHAATDRNVFDVLVELFEGGPVPAPLIARRAASHSFLAVDHDVTVRDDLPADWFDAYRPRLHSGSGAVSAGDRLRAMDGNFDTYGVVRVLGDDAADAERRCAEIRAEIERDLGVPFVAVGDPAARADVVESR